MMTAMAAVTDRLNSVQRPATSAHCLRAVCKAETCCSRTSVSLSLPNWNRGKNDIAGTPNEPSFAHIGNNGAIKNNMDGERGTSTFVTSDRAQRAERGSYDLNSAPLEPTS